MRTPGPSRTTAIGNASWRPQAFLRRTSKAAWTRLPGNCAPSWPTRPAAGLLRPRPDADSEYAVTGILDGALATAYFDRTFEEDGVRWIIDYKTGEADSDPSSLKATAARYRPQLARYRTLAESLFDAPIKTALYLTAIPTLVEV